MTQLLVPFPRPPTGPSNRAGALCIMAMSAYIMKRQANALSWARLVQPAAVEAASCAWHPACLGPDSTSEQRQPPGVPGPWTVDSGSFLRRAYSKGRPHAQHGRAQERRQKGGTPHGAVSVHIRDFDRPTPVAPSKPVQAAEPAKPSLVQVRGVLGRGGRGRVATCYCQNSQ